MTEDFRSTSVDLIIQPQIAENDLGFLSFAEEDKQKDLLYVKFLLVSSGFNNNWDKFLALELLKSWKSPRNKQINWKHDAEKIIGHIQNSVLSYNRTRLTEEEIDQFLRMEEPPKGQYDIYCSGVIYKVACPFFAAKVLESVSASAKRGDSNYLSVSMEVLFTNWYYEVGGQIFGREMTDRFDYMRSTHTEYNGQPVYRVLKNLVFSGCGITPRPANFRSELIAAASECVNEEELTASAIHKNVSPSSLDDQELVFDHSLLHRLYKLYVENGSVNGWSREDILNYHALIMKEMMKRGMEHKTHDKLDEDTESKSPGVAVKHELLFQLPQTIDIKSDYISVVGSFVDRDDFDDIDLYVDNSFSVSLPEKIHDKVCHVIESLGEPDGNKIPLYKLMLVRNDAFEVSLKKPSIAPLDTDIEFCHPQVFIDSQEDLRNACNKKKKLVVSKYIEGSQVLIHKSDSLSGTSRVYALDEGGNEVVLAELFDAVSASSVGNFIVSAVVRDDIVYLTDCLYRNSSELINVPYETRLYFLEKLFAQLPKESGEYKLKMLDYIVSKQEVLDANVELMLFERKADSIILIDSNSLYSHEDADEWIIFEPSQDLQNPVQCGGVA